MRAAAYYERGNARFDQGDYQGAIVDYGQAIELDPRHARASTTRAGPRRARPGRWGAGGLRAGDRDRSRSTCAPTATACRCSNSAASYRLSRPTTPGWPSSTPTARADYRYRQGSALQGLRDLVGARVAYDAALARDPEHVDALYQRALLSFAERAHARRDRRPRPGDRAQPARGQRLLRRAAWPGVPRATRATRSATSLRRSRFSPATPRRCWRRAAAYHAASDDARARADLEQLAGMRAGRGVASGGGGAARADRRPTAAHPA